MTKSLITYSIDQKDQNKVQKGYIEIQQVNSEKRVKLSVLADILSYYAWMNKPDRYDPEKVGDTVLKLIKSQGIGLGGDIQVFLDTRIKNNMEFLRDGTRSAPIFDALDRCRSEYLGNSAKGPILAVSIDMDPFNGLMDAFLRETSMHAVRTVNHGHTSVLVPLFRMVAWISSQIIDCPHFANLMGRTRSAGRMVASKIKGSSEYAGRLSKIFFSLICILDGSGVDSLGTMDLRFDTASVQNLLPKKLFEVEMCNYNLLFLGNETLKSEVIDSFLDRMHTDATVIGSRKSMGNSSYRRFRVTGNSVFEIYDVHETRCKARFMCTMDSIGSRMAPGGYVAVVCSENPEGVLKIANDFGYDGVGPVVTCVIGAAGPVNYPMIPRSDEGLRALEHMRMYGVDSSAESSEFTDYFFLNILETLGLPKDELDTLESTSSLKGINSMMVALVNASVSLKEISLGVAVILASAFSALWNQQASYGAIDPDQCEEFNKILDDFRNRMSFSEVFF